MILKFFRLKNLHFYLLGIYLVITPFLFFPDLGIYDSKRILQLYLFSALSILFLFFSFHASRRWEPIHLSKNIMLFVGTFLALGVLSCFFSEFSRFAFIEMTMLAVIFYCCTLFSEQTTAGHYRLGKLIYSVATIFSVVYLVYFLGNYIAAYLNPLVPMWPNRLAVSIQIGDTVYSGKEVLYFGNRRFFNHIQTWTLPLLAALPLYFKTKTVYRNLMLVLLLCWWSLVFASGARGTLVSIVLACIVLFILFRKRSYRFLSTAAGTAIGGYGLYFVMFKAFVPGDSLPVIRMTDSARLEKWGKAWELWLAKPVLGVGPMHYAATGDPAYSAHPHNFYLQLLAEWGIVALLCFLAMLVLYLLFIKKRFLKSNYTFIEMAPRNSAVYMGIMGSAVAGFAHAGVSGIFHTPMSQVWAIMVIAWLISLWNRNSDSVKTISVSRKQVSIGYIFLIGALIYLVSPDISRLDKNHTKFRETFQGESISPRFWEQGLIYEGMDTPSFLRPHSGALLRNDSEPLSSIRSGVTDGAKSVDVRRSQ